MALFGLESPTKQDGLLLRCFRCCCLGEPSRAQVLKKSVWLLHLIGDLIGNVDIIYLLPLLGMKEAWGLRYSFTNSVPEQPFLYPVGQHTLALYTKCVTPVNLMRVH